MKVAVDSSVLVALLNPHDLWRGQAIALRQTLLTADVELLYFDCVVAEAISTATRRLHEKSRLADIGALFDRLDNDVPANTVTWILPDVPRLYPEILGLMRSSLGALNFHDALIALACREREIPAIASFDVDFDQVAWLRRLAGPEDVNP
jgi:predicted nucleic acid-binding protein